MQSVRASVRIIFPGKALAQLTKPVNHLTSTPRRNWDSFWDIGTGVWDRKSMECNVPLRVYGNIPLKIPPVLPISFQSQCFNSVRYPIRLGH
jgi:hypothetical protein